MEKALSDENLLRAILGDIRQEIGINETQSVSSDVFEYKAQQVLLQYAVKGKIDQKKVFKLRTQKGDPAAWQILVDTAICLMEEWGIIKGGVKLP